MNGGAAAAPAARETPPPPRDDEKALEDWSPEERAALSRGGCVFIKRLCGALGLKLLSKCTALVFFHRFFQRQSFKSHDRFVVGAAAVFLASKVEEDLRKLPEVARRAQELHDFGANSDTVLPLAGADAKNDVAAEQGSSAVHRPTVLQEKVLLCERLLLHTLSFDVSVTHPHVHALTLIQGLHKWEGSPSEFRIAAWAFLTDSLFTDACLHYTPEALAAASVFLACQLLRERERLGPDTAKALDAIEREHLADARAPLLFGFPRALIEEITGRVLDVYDPPQALPADAGECSLVAAARRQRDAGQEVEGRTATSAGSLFADNAPLALQAKQATDKRDADKPEADKHEADKADETDAGAHGDGSPQHKRPRVDSS